MASQKIHTLGNELIGNSDGLLGIAIIIFGIENELLTIDAACGIDVGHGMVCTPS